MEPTPRRRRPPARPAAQTLLLRRLGGVAALLLLGFVLVRLAGAGFGGGDGSDTASAREDTGAEREKADPRPEPTELPGGGRRIFPDRRVVAFYGNPADEELGALGIGTPDQAAAKLKKVAKSYERESRPVLPCLELITTVAAAAPGDDGKYRIQVPEKTIDKYYRAARRSGSLLLLDVQPGIATFPEEVRRLKKWLVKPDVGLALDPEWRIQPGQVPGQVIGSVSAEEVNNVSIDLAALVKERNLPEKLFVIHQFTNDMVKNKPQVKLRKGLATVFNVDGFGLPAAKVSKYNDFTAATPKGAHDGFKVFFREDTNRMRPAAVMALRPRPDLVVYE